MAQPTIIVIGAGAAGLMATATIIEQVPQAQVILIEKNGVLGRKVSISGGGRCNVTTGIRDVRQLLTKYYRGSKFLTTAMYQFSPEQVYHWFETHGVPLKTEEDLRVFPQSNVGTDVVAAFERLFAQSAVQVLTKQSVEHVEYLQSSNQPFHVRLKSDTTLTANYLVITTGGQAYRHTGSTGDGYAFAEALGHHITPLAASLNSFIVENAWAKTLAGVSFEWLELTVTQKDQNTKKLHSAGPLVFTHQGISGPAVFALSSQIAFIHYTKNTPLTCLIDFHPELSDEQIRHELNQAIADKPNQQIKTTLHRWLPKSVVAALLEEIGLPADKTNHDTSKIMRQRMIDWLKRCPIQLVGRAAGDEFVTAGGVDTAEIDPRTMASKLCPHLYFAGEVMNVDGITGGFNLQASWAAGHLAGMSIATQLTETN